MAASIWQPLASETSIRLLTLVPGDNQDPVLGTLHQIDLKDGQTPYTQVEEPDELPRYVPSPLLYDAASYTWGESTDQQVIYIGGKRISIRKNLHEFLLQLRGRCYPRTIWVDALCINQSNENEKTTQVAMIGHIIRRARRVLAWVGQHANGSELLFRDNTCLSQSSPEEPKTANIKNRAEALGHFLRRRYWSRRWVVQEIALASSLTVYCGDDCADWHTLMNQHLDPANLPPTGYAANDLSQDLVYVSTYGTSQIRRLMQIRQQLRSGGGHTTLDLLSAFEDYQCEDRRDVLYALLTMCDDIYSQIQPNYRLDVSEVLVWLYSTLILNRQTATTDSSAQPYPLVKEVVLLIRYFKIYEHATETYRLIEAAEELCSGILPSMGRTSSHPMLGLAMFEALSQVLGVQTPIPRDIGTVKLTPPYVRDIAKRLRSDIEASWENENSERERTPPPTSLYHSLPTRSLTSRHQPHSSP